MAQGLVDQMKRAVINRIPGTGRLKVAKTWTKTYAASIGKVQRDEADGYALVGFEGENGFDYDAYRSIQEEGNKAKLHGQWVTRGHIQFLADHITALGVTVRRGACHGTRQGFEQGWFREALPDADVFGTEISSTAAQFAHTVQWDFHEVNPDWVGALDLVYSNSWDHAYDPDKAVTAWLETLTPGGVLLLDHSRYHLPDRANELDPFGADFDNLTALVARLGAGLGEVLDPVENTLSDDTTSAPVDLPVKTLIFRRAVE